MEGVYKYMVIKQSDNEIFAGKPVFRITNKKSGSEIGIIVYYKPWKEYVFRTTEDCIFNNTCMRDIIDFMENKIQNG